LSNCSFGESDFEQDRRYSAYDNDYTRSKSERRLPQRRTGRSPRREGSSRRDSCNYKKDSSVKGSEIQAFLNATSGDLKGASTPTRSRY